MLNEIIKTWQDLVFCPCKIKPLENMDGVITSVCISYLGLEYKVRYYFNGEQKNEWFQCYEILIAGTPQY